VLQNHFLHIPVEVLGLVRLGSFLVFFYFLEICISLRVSSNNIIKLQLFPRIDVSIGEPTNEIKCDVERIYTKTLVLKCKTVFYI